MENIAISFNPECLEEIPLLLSVTLNAYSRNPWGISVTQNVEVCRVFPNILDEMKHENI